MGLCKVRPIFDFILLDLAIPELFYFKHDVVASDVIVFIDNPDVDSLSDAIPVLP